LATQRLCDLSLAIIVGVIVGTYSSIFIASPIVLLWSRARGESTSALRREITQKTDGRKPAGPLACLAAKLARLLRGASTPFRFAIKGFGDVMSKRNRFPS